MRIEQVNFLTEIDILRPETLQLDFDSEACVKSLTARRRSNLIT